MQGDDPAGGEHVADLAQPGSRTSSPPARRAPGSAAPSSAGSCRPRRRRRAARAPGRRGRTTARRTSTAAGRSGVVISSTTTRPPGRTTRAISRRPCVQVGEVARAEADGGGVERVVVVGQRERVGGLEAHGARPAPPRRAALSRASSSIRSEKSAPTTSPPGADAPGELERQVARCRSPRRARGRPGRQAGQIGRPPTPLVVQPRGHDRVHAVVDAPRSGRTSPAPASRAACRRARPARAPTVRRPGGDGALAVMSADRRLLQHRQEVDEVLELLRGLLGQARERRHRRRRVAQRRGDRRRAQRSSRCGSAAARGRCCRCRRSRGRRGSRTAPTTSSPGLEGRAPAAASASPAACRSTEFGEPVLAPE